MSKVKKDKKRCKSNHKKGINLTSNSSKNKILRTKETKKWSSDEDKLLTNLVRSQKYQNFSEISKKIPGRSNTQCRLRWNIIKKTLKKGQWSIYEDKLLKDWIKTNGPKKWEQCGKFINGRSGKQCREHWSNCLNPELVKGEWTNEEDFLIMQFYEKCRGSWKKIIRLFNGRTENAIKNRFFSQLRKIASKNMTISERKFCSKIKLEELKKFLKEALSHAKKNFLNNNPMSEKELEEYLKKMKSKIKKNLLVEENDGNNKNNIYTINTENIEDKRKSLKSENKKKIFIGKRKRSSYELFDNSTNEEDKNLNIQIHQEKPNNISISNNNNNSIDENKKSSINYNIINNNNYSNDINQTKNDFCKIIKNNNNNNNNNININIYNNEDDDNKSHTFINYVDSGNVNNSNILENLDYQYSPSYKFLENCELWRVDSIGNILIDEKSQFDLNNKKYRDIIDEQNFIKNYKNILFND